ncbi:MAG: rhamnulokinase [Paramuribaculum sp.]|nr:rhamnulokinase [Paramuribaculum sp.]
MSEKTFIAVDFGGGSGRVIAGSLSPEGNIEMNEIHRFANGPVEKNGHLYWDFSRLCGEMTEGLRKAAGRYDNIVSIGIDTWGVDFGLLENDSLDGISPYCYRDTAWNGSIADAEKIVGARELYRRNGLQPIGINSLYRLMWMSANGESFEGKKLLFMPDLFNFHLCGTAANEYTIASTSGLIEASTGCWDRDLMKQLSIPESIFCPIVRPGDVIGTLLPEIAEATGLPRDVKVVAVGSHDTASAVNAISLDGNTAFLSSGTWSLLGIELPAPVTTAEAADAGYANEGGTNGILFLQNITGLWILQQLVEQWRARNLTCDYPSLVDMAEKASTDTIIDVDNADFATHGDMEQKIRDYCTARRLKTPGSQGEFVRILLQSLADRYRRGLDEMETATGRRITHLHIIGGGSRNRLLNRLTEERTGRKVTAGPAEATAIGNIMTQSRVHHTDTPIVTDK